MLMKTHTTLTASNFVVIKLAEKDHDVIVFDGARTDCLRICLQQNPRLVNTEDDIAIHV